MTYKILLLHPGLSEIYNELLTDQSGNEFYVRSGEHFAGETALGVLHRSPDNSRRLQLNPNRETALDIQPHDQLVILADTGIHKGAR